jgi:hypothetical protein
MKCPYCQIDLILKLTTMGKLYECNQESHEFKYYVDTHPSTWSILHHPTELFVCQEFIAYNDAQKHPGKLLKFSQYTEPVEGTQALIKLMKLGAFL